MTKATVGDMLETHILPKNQSLVGIVAKSIKINKQQKHTMANALDWISNITNISNNWITKYKKLRLHKCLFWLRCFLNKLFTNLHCLFQWVRGHCMQKLMIELMHVEFVERVFHQCQMLIGTFVKFIWKCLENISLIHNTVLWKHLFSSIVFVIKKIKYLLKSLFLQSKYLGSWLYRLTLVTSVFPATKPLHINVTPKLILKPNMWKVMVKFVQFVAMWPTQRIH